MSALNRVNDNNKRIYERNVPNFPPQMVFDSRPVSTKYDVLPILEKRNEGNTHIEQRSLFNHKSHFLPGDAGPVSTFLTNIDQESMLRNQFFALQKADQSQYVPPSNSDLYEVQVVGRREPQNHDLLFKNYVENNMDSKIQGLNQKVLFNNNTRQKTINDV
jgi:hypothetical protein